MEQVTYIQCFLREVPPNTIVDTGEGVKANSIPFLDLTAGVFRYSSVLVDLPRYVLVIDIERSLPANSPVRRLVRNKGRIVQACYPHQGKYVPVQSFYLVSADLPVKVFV